MWVCSHCGCQDVYQDAWVNVNDEEDVISVFENFYCTRCEGECSVDEVKDIEDELVD